MRSVIIREDNNAIWFNPSFSIPINNTNLPVGSFRFVEHRPVYWKAQMHSYNKNSKNLRLHIIDYGPTELSEFKKQRQKAELRTVEFDGFSLKEMVKDLTYFKKESFEGSESAVTQNMDTEINESKLQLKIPLKDMIFHAGYISFNYKFRFEAEQNEIKIFNDHILPEFNYIKPYFSKYLGLKKCDVQVTVYRKDKITQKIKATSGQLDMISDAAAEVLKFIKTQIIKKITRKIIPVNKALFTPAELFSSFGENDPGYKLISQKDIMEEIIRWQDVRNRKHLEYLSGFIHDHAEKIRFTLSPDFGFLFKHSGKRMNHYLWEMLNSNATYVWGFDKLELTESQCLEKIEEIVSFIRINGRETYLNDFDAENGYVFTRIFHKGANSNFIDHFPKWKNKLVECLI